MKASALEFRFRYLLHTLVLGLGLFLPWGMLFPAQRLGANAHTWGFLSVWLSQQHLLAIGTAFVVLLSLGILLAVAAAGLRTWGTAYLGAAVVEGSSMQAAIVTDGPFRYLRNPLYVGTLLHTLALSLLMPVAGAVFSIVLIALMQVRLILGEEAFLSTRLGPPYQAYCALVPRVLPSLRSRVVPTGLRPLWGQAFLVEIYMWGVAASFAFFGWQFNAPLLVQSVLVSMGLGIVVRGLQMRSKVAASPVR